MMNVQILCIGKLKEAYWRGGLCRIRQTAPGFLQFYHHRAAESRLPDNPSQGPY